MNRTFLFRKDMTPIKKLLYMKAAAGGTPLSEYTATGNPLSFNTNIVKPLKSLVLPWTPTQSGTGDPSPSNVRPISGVSALNVTQTGANLFDATCEMWNKRDVYTINSDGSVTQAKSDGRSWADGSDNNIVPIFMKAGTYYISCSDNGVFNIRTNLDGYDSNKQIASGSGSFTIPSDCLVKIKHTKNADTSYPVTFTVMLNVGSSPATYSPYTGQSYPVTFPALGKNLLPPSAYKQGYYNGNTGEFVASDNYISYALDLKAGTYTFSTDLANCVVLRYFIGNAVTSVSEQKQKQVFALESDNTFRITIRNTSTSAISNPNSMIEAGNVTPSAYEPYTNTVYGGTLDVTTGVLTVEWAKVQISALTWEYQTQWGGRFRATLAGKDGEESSVSANVLCPIYKASVDTSADNIICGYGKGSRAIVYIKDGRYTDKNTFVESVGDEYIYYPIVDAVTVQLTPQQITALLGDNTIWSDTNGSNTAIYLKKG